MKLEDAPYPIVAVVCERCKEEKPLTAFAKRTNTKKGIQGVCKECRKEAYPQQPASHKKSQIKYRYGLEWEQWLEIYEAQKGGCAICNIHLNPVLDKSVHVDHDHDTGAVRGLLCRKCNHGLGLFKDSPTILEKAAEYLHERKYRGFKAKV